MIFYSGFSLSGDEVYFKRFINPSCYSVCGFSYGAIKAFLHVKNCIDNAKRVDTLQLFSPAFFQTKSKRFKTMQINAYKKNKKEYLKKFIAKCFSPCSVDLSLEFGKSNADELEELLQYTWDQDMLQDLANKGVKIEVYLGELDQIIDVQSARDFFTQSCDVTYMQNANHFLQKKA